MLELSKRRHVRLLATRRILLEAERNIRLKLGRDALLHYYRDIAESRLRMVKPPNLQEITSYTTIIAPKDAHVLAAAIKGRATHLLTLDRRHFMTPSIARAGLPLTIQTPGEFLRVWAEQQE